MDVVFARGEVSAAEVAAAIPNPPSYSAVRALLRILEEKGCLKHREDGQRYLFSPVVQKEVESRSALGKVLDTFFKGSLSDAVSSLVDSSEERLTLEEITRLEAIVKKAADQMRR